MKLLTLSEVNAALAVTTVSAAQLSSLGFEPIPLAPDDLRAMPDEDRRRLRSAKAYREEDLPSIRAAIAKQLHDVLPPWIEPSIPGLPAPAEEVLIRHDGEIHLGQFDGRRFVTRSGQRFSARSCAWMHPSALGVGA